MTYQLSDNVQRGCLYLLKHDVDFFSQIVAMIKPEYFDFPSYQRLFTGVRDYYEKYGCLPTDDSLVEFVKYTTPENVKDDNNYEEDLVSINQIDQEIFNHKEFIVDVLEDFAKKRSMVEAIKRCGVLVKEEKIGDIEPIIREALLVGRKLEIGQDYFEDVRDRVHRMFQQKNVDKFPTVFPTCNKALEGGLCAKELAIVIAPPGVRKISVFG